MLLIDHSLTASDVLRAFHHDELNLFLGAAFATVGLIAIGFSIIRRKFDILLTCFAGFAILYGIRLWLQSRLLAMMVPPSDFFDRLRMSINFVVPIPGFIFFQASGFLRRTGKIAAYIFCGAEICLLVAIVLGARLQTLNTINSVIVIAAVIPLLLQSFRSSEPAKDYRTIRAGLLIFATFILITNISELLGFNFHVEAFGFTIFLCCLGYVAARQTLERDEQLSEIKKELEIAKRIQLSILPESFPHNDPFRVAARYVPMRSVAGDFYDFLVADSRQAGLLIADVSGHGVPAALIASMVKLAASSQRAVSNHPATLLSTINAMLCGNTQSQYVTAAYVHLDAESQELRYAAAAHPPMLLLREGEVLPIEENGLMLALFPDAAYTTATRRLQPGDRLLLYTDGIIEAADSKDQQFGHHRLCELLKESAGKTHDETADLIIDSVQRWAASQDDDLTVLVCDYA